MNESARIDFKATICVISQGGLKRIKMCLLQCPVPTLPVCVNLVPQFTDDAKPINSDLSLQVMVPASRELGYTTNPSVNIWDLTNILRKLFNDNALTIVDSMSTGVCLTNGRPYVQIGEEYAPMDEDLVDLT